MKITTETEVFYNRMKPYVTIDESLHAWLIQGWSAFYKAMLNAEKPKAETDKEITLSSAEKVSFMHVDDDPTEPYDRYITNTVLAKMGYLATSEVAYSGNRDDGRSRIRMYLASIDSPNNVAWANQYYAKM